MKKILVAVLFTLALSSTVIAKSDKVTICHAAGKEGTTHFVTLTISENAVYGRNGNAGHFEENGTPRAGHEQDYFGACTTESSPTPSGQPTPTASPTPTPSETPTPSTSETPAVPELPNTAME